MILPEVQSSGSTDPPMDPHDPSVHAELTAAVAARDVFIAVAAHELRNPMTPMVGQLDLLLTGLRAGRLSMEQIERRLVRIHQAMNNYLKRATALLDVSRLTSGKFRLDVTIFDLSELVRQVVETFAEPARYVGSPITLVVPPSLVGRWDYMAMEQIIDNLVSNAVKYGGSRPIEVRAEALDAQVSITVRDRGPGIPLKDRTRIFSRFERVIGQNERRSGFGIGLWVVGQLVTAMNGSIAVEDVAGGGTAFMVSLPRHVGAALT